MAMRRRAFLELCAGSIGASVIGCVPEVTEAPTRRDDPRSPRVVGDGGPEEIDGDGGARPDPGGGEASRDAGAPGGDVTPLDGSPPEPRDAGSVGHDAGCDDVVVMYDTYAQSLYFDGSHGPTTGVIRVDYVLAGAAVELEFWHGHGGVSHRFTVTPAHFESLKRGERVTIETTAVDAHTHQLFVDPVDPRYRVPGARGVSVPVCG